MLKIKRLTIDHINYFYIFVEKKIMTSITIYPKTEEQYKVLKNLCEKMNIPFDNIDEKEIGLLEEQINSIKKGLSQIEKGLVTKSEDIHSQAMEICLK
ncbi:hypothetical protein KRX57_10510 [Weeksellaceae bacterium TAE3-ERU29]|nr:hypothetical protein [Weeksellaceae bacterium TAE3-ERU29]